MQLFETGFTNPIDQAILNFKKIDVSEYKKQDEIPMIFSGNV